MSEIVVGYDGSSCGNAALDEALALAGPLGDHVTVVFGYAPPGIWGGEIADHEKAIEELGERVTADARRRAEASGAEIDVELVPKHATEALVAAAEERDARMIVVGSGGEGALKGFILGTTPHKLLHLSQRPVLVVHTDD
jgi:nucleotide-binding universal stress UspA family protein